MSNSNKTRVKVKWLKGFEVETTNEEFLTKYIGPSLKWVAMSFSIYLIVHAIAPHGFI